MQVKTASRLRALSYLMLIGGMLGLFLYDEMTPSSLGGCANAGCVGAGAAAGMVAAAVLILLWAACSLVNAVAFFGQPGRTSWLRRLELTMFVFPWVGLLTLLAVRF